MWTVEILVMLSMIVVNSVLAAFEIALASITVSRLQVMLRESRSGSVSALYMKQNMEGSLAAIQLGITLVGAIAAATGGAGAEEKLAPYLAAALSISKEVAEVLAIAVVVLPLTIVTILFGELIPKVFALRNKEWVCLRLAPPMYWFTTVVWPVVRAFEMTVSGIMRIGERHLKGRLDQAVKSESSELQELRASVALARTSRLLGAHEEKIILGAAALSQKPVGDIMLPAANIHLLDIQSPIAESLVAAHLDMHTRFPVAERPRDPQTIVGYVNFKDIVAVMRASPHDPSIRAVVRDIPSFQEHTTVSACLQTLMHDRTHIALIRNAIGEVIGMVTLEDIMEELVGEIEDEYDRIPAHVSRSGNNWIVGGGISLIKLRQATNLDLTADLPSQGANTLTEWVIGHLGKPLEGGESLQRGEVRVVVRKVRRHKMLEAQIGRSTPTVRSESEM